MNAATYRRGQCREKNGFKYTRWLTSNGQYAVERSEYLGQAELADTFRTLQLDPWDDSCTILTTHRTRKAAEDTVARLNPR